MSCFGRRGIGYNYGQMSKYIYNNIIFAPLINIFKYIHIYLLENSIYSLPMRTVHARAQMQRFIKRCHSLSKES